MNISQNQILSLKDTMLVYSPELKYFECSQNKISSLGFLTNFRPFMRYKGNNFEKSVCTFDLNKNGFIKQLDLNVIMNIDFFKSLQIDFSKVESFDLDRYTSKNIIRSNLNKETFFINLVNGLRRITPLVERALEVDVDRWRNMHHMSSEFYCCRAAFSRPHIHRFWQFDSMSCSKLLNKYIHYSLVKFIFF